MVTTDGHRLSKAEYKQPARRPHAELRDARAAEGHRRAQAPDRGGQARAQPKGEEQAARRSASRPRAATRSSAASDVLLSVKLADEQFPPYTKVIPQAAVAARGRVARALLVDSLKRISLVASDKSGAVRFDVEPGIAARSPARTPTSARAAKSSTSTSRARRSRSASTRATCSTRCRALTEDEVALELGGELDPGVIKPVGADRLRRRDHADAHLSRERSREVRRRGRQRFRRERGPCHAARRGIGLPRCAVALCNGVVRRGAAASAAAAQARSRCPKAAAARPSCAASSWRLLGDEGATKAWPERLRIERALTAATRSSCG